MSSSINLITSTLYHPCQSCLPYNHRTSPPNGLETRIAMIFADQTQYVDQTPSGTLVTIQPKLVANGRAVKCQRVEIRLTYSVFRNRASCKSARG